MQMSISICERPHMDTSMILICIYSDMQTLLSCDRRPKAGYGSDGMYIFFATEQKRILRENYADLVLVIQDPANLAASLFARGIIGDAVRDEIQSLFVSKQKMNAVLINAVESQLLVNPSAFEVLMEVMEGEVYLSPIVKKMRGECVFVLKTRYQRFYWSSFGFKII